jgi:hypothetical protein
MIPGDHRPIFFSAEYIVLFIYFVLACLGWGAWACERTKLPFRFLFMLGFAVLAVLAYLLFFVCLLDAVTGRVVFCLLGVGSLGIAARQLAIHRVRQELRNVDVWLPVWLLLVYTASCLLVLFLHGSDPNNALRVNMPSDNVLPEYLSDILWNGGPVTKSMRITWVNVKPFFGDWLSSDRPPLQAALFLFCRPFEFLGFTRDEIYTLASTLFQATWIPAVYLLARQLRFSRETMAFMLIWFCGSGFFLFHTIFTWPKLLSASFFLGGLSVLLFCAENLPKKYPAALLGLGLLWGLALLSHGSVFFSFLAVPLLASAWRVAWAHPRAIMGAVMVFVAVQLPWSGYQKFYDPPANRLVKWHLAGVIPVDSRGTWQTLRDSYGSLSFQQWAQNRWSNLETTLFWDKPSATDLSSLREGQLYLTTQCFFRVSAALGLLSLGLVVMAFGWFRGKRPGPPGFHSCGELLLMNMGCYLAWIILMFLPGGTVVHQGSFVMIVLFMIIAVSGMMELPAWAKRGLLVGHWILFAFLFLYYFAVPPHLNAEWFVAQAVYWLFALLFALSVWRFLLSAKDVEAN